MDHYELYLFPDRVRMVSKQPNVIAGTQPCVSQLVGGSEPQRGRAATSSASLLKYKGGGVRKGTTATSPLVCTALDLSTLKC